MPSSLADFSCLVEDPHTRLGPMTYRVRTRTTLWPYADAARTEDGCLEVRRRFNEFAELRAELAKRAAAHEEASPRANPLAAVAALPSLPQKALFASTSSVRAPSCAYRR
jgi:hypothetical protein